MFRGKGSLYDEPERQGAIRDHPVVRRRMLHPSGKEDEEPVSGVPRGRKIWLEGDHFVAVLDEGFDARMPLVLVEKFDVCLLNFIDDSK